MSAQPSIFPSSRPYQRPMPLLPVVVVLATAALAAMIAFDVMLEAALVAVALVLAAVAFRWPVPSAIFLVAFTPVNRFVIFQLYHFTGSDVLLRASQLWKDGLILVVLVSVTLRALQRGKAPRVYLFDILVVGFLLFNAIYVVYPGTLADNSLEGRLLGFRLDAYFLLAYFVGRGLDLERRHVRWLVLALVPGTLAVAGVAVFQFLFPDAGNRLWNDLGFQQFVVAVHGSSNIAVRARDVAGISVPRASSLLMGDLALAFYMLLVVPFAGAAYFAKRKGSTLPALAFFLLMLAVLAMSGARSALLALPVALGAIVVLTVALPRAYLVVTLTVLAGISALVIFAGGLNSGWLSGLFASGEGSRVAHADAIHESIQLVRAQPFGRGLGTSHTVAYQLGLQDTFANESWYLQLATEIGIAGAGLYALIMIVISVAPLAAYLRVRDYYLGVVALGVGGAGIAFALVGIVLHVWETPVIGAVFWLFAGVAIRAEQLEKSWEQAEPPAT